MFTKAKLHFVQMNKPLQTLHALCFAAALVGGTVASAERPPPIRVPAGVPKAPALKTGEFKAGTEFVKNQRYYSADGRYAMVFQADGNLVVYKFTDAAKSKFHPIWYSRTNGKAVEKCVFQTDGNLVLYDYTKKPV